MSRIGTGSGPFLISTDLEYDKTRGWETIEVWEGSEAEIAAKQLAVVEIGATRALKMSNGDGNYRLRASYPYEDPDTPTETLVDTMELDTAAIARSVYQSPVFRSRFSDYANNVSAKGDMSAFIVGDLVRKYQAGQPKQETNGKYKYLTTEYDSRELAIHAEFKARMDTAGIATTSATYGASSGDAGLAWGLYVNIVSRGVTSFLEYNSVFRRTVTAATPSAVTANFEGSNKIWTTAEVISWESIPNDGWFVLPAGVQWHKDTPRVLSAFGQKTQLVYSYTQVRSATRLLYEAYNGATLIT